ncbi:MAG TPA: long-chain-acyl-CoA synthetase, partial [Pseudomonadales bacterium]|nr:long-chain-acyl-CoA synthetase [Pseudomonadales bacterium]
KPPKDTDIGSIAILVEDHAARHPDDVALLCEDEAVSWKELNDRANRIAHVLEAQGIGRGDCVSLFMQNRIEFVVNILALSKLGAVAGMINSNLTRQPLIHCINLIESKKCIFGEELTEPLEEVRSDLKLDDGKDFLFVRDTGSSPPPNWAVTLDSRDDAIDASNLPQSKQVQLGEKAFYIFTSGTTGMPKAAVVTSKRALPISATSARLLMRITRADRVYNCLPLYHGTGLMIGLMAAFQVGASTVLRRRLSVSAFWDDVRKYHCTAFVYIGEFIRYLMSQPPQPDDADNPVRTIVGNGLRPDIWMQFKERFAIERIGEFYGASEGNGGFANVFNKDCTVGLGTAPVAIVKYDVSMDEIVRDDNGHCIPMPDGQSGLLLIKVTDDSKFEGYTDAEATEKKLVRNVLEDGDIYFNSGDLMRTVDVGFAFGQKHYQFVDRIGDTFRWKSENVSTNEVGELINKFPDIIFTNVYGVEVPGTDGRAGMAAIVFRQGADLASVDLAALSRHINDNLPSYARPIFIRVLKELPTTSTHKLQKSELREQAYHLDKVQDDILVMKPGESVYTRLDTDFYHKIMEREAGY